MIDKEILTLLKKKQDAEKDLQKNINEEKAKFDVAVLNYKNKLSAIKKEIEDLKGTITKEALEEYDETNNKTLTGGLKIRNTTSVNFDHDEAMAWAKKSESCLLLDMKSFNSIAKTGTLDFVKLETIPSVTFPKEIKLE